MENQLFNRLTPTSIKVFMRINPDSSDLQSFSVKALVDILSKDDIVLGKYTEGLKPRHTYTSINIEKLLIYAFHEASLLNSSEVDVIHITLALLNIVNTEKYYIAKNYLVDHFQNHLEKSMNSIVEELNGEKVLDDLIGREKDLTRLMVVLSSNYTKPILLKGPEGIGKTSIIRQLAKLISQNLVPDNLKNTTVLRIKFNTLLNLVYAEGVFLSNQNISRIINTIALIGRKNKDRVILFIDDLRFSQSLAIGIEKQSDNDETIVIGAADDESLDKMYDTNILKMWDIIDIPEISPDKLRLVLKKQAKTLESQTGYKFPLKVINFIIDIKTELPYTESMPAAGIKLLSLIASYKKHMNMLANQTVNSKTGVVDVSDVENFLNLNYAYNNQEDVVYANLYSKDLEKKLKSKIIGQDEAIENLVQALKISSLKLSSQNRPVGTFLFLGPTGVGKTQTAKTLAEVLFGFRDKYKIQPANFIRIDMTDYSEKHSVSKLFGAPPGYVGYDEGGFLAEQLKDNNTSVILFDEIDKAHPEVLNSLLAIMDESEIRDNTGEIIPLYNSIIIMTSNHGVELLNKPKLGFIEDDIGYEVVRDILTGNIKKKLKPEFLNRFDSIIIFNQLASNDLVNILDLILKPVYDNLKMRKVHLSISKLAKDLIIEKGYNIEYGVRELKRVLNKELLNPLADILIHNKSLKKIIVSRFNDSLKFNVK